MLYGIDINREAIATAKRYFFDQSDERVYLNVGRADLLARFSDASIDVVFTDAVLMFIAPDRIHTVLSGLARVARKGIVLNEYHSPGETEGRFDGGRWVYDFAALLQQQIPHAHISTRKSTFTGGDWDAYGTLIEVRL
jgi:ubiquinone/menaquinone biosynthesis C-methylase UbiE